jgi:hypothetical protein
LSWGILQSVMPTHIIIFKFYINDFSCSKEAVKERTNI